MQEQNGMNSPQLEERAPRGAHPINSRPKGLALLQDCPFPWEGSSPSLLGDGRVNKPFSLWAPALALPCSAPPRRQAGF